MARRKGEMTSRAIDRGWPHQVALRGEFVRLMFFAIEEFKRGLSVCARGHTVAQAGDWWQVYCFADPEHAEKFRLKFNGRKFDPALKGRGRNWARYRGEL